MVYSASPPYEILQNKLIDFATMQKLRRFARYWDLIGNSGNFVDTTRLIWEGSPSSFHAFAHWCEWLFGRTRRTDSIALSRLMEFLFEFLAKERGMDPRKVAQTLWSDYQRGGRRDKPSFLKDFLPAEPDRTATPQNKTALPKRQARHLV